jgi:hypothetical protein
MNDWCGWMLTGCSIIAVSAVATILMVRVIASL